MASSWFNHRFAQVNCITVSRSPTSRSNSFSVQHDYLKPASEDSASIPFEAHDGQKRQSGEPFIIHPVEVARILGELELDWESIGKPKFVLSVRNLTDLISCPWPGTRNLDTHTSSCVYLDHFALLSNQFSALCIRTGEMDLIAKRGIAAHYSGKVIVNGLVRHTMANDRYLRGKPVCLNNANVALRIGWLNAIREWQEEFVGNMSSREFVDTITKDLLGSRVFVFTPRGEDLKSNGMISYLEANGNIVPPLHVLANAEVVEIVTYNALSSKSAFQRHKQWLQHAKTRSARYKIMKAVDSVNEFLADSRDDSEAEEVVTDYSKGTHLTWEKILMNVMEMSSMKMMGADLFQVNNGCNIKVSKVNGKHNKHVKEEPLYEGNGFAKMILGEVPMYKQVLPGLDSWRDGKVSSWSDFEGHSIQWMCTVCIDRRGMFADISKALADVGVIICSCAAEVVRGRGMCVILFHVEASMENMVSAFSRADLVLGVLGWSTGCTWPGLTKNQQVTDRNMYHYVYLKFKEANQPGNAKYANALKVYLLSKDHSNLKIDFQ
ncbi:hypothetical protein L2E82_06137 [Cichorium intybus]|uniref:Uncharacterized protein n=1 Tax=Cichorium intybus TaxID=13427 RepID=A0ACB9H971_CICIN|nr:hypothetical protein L2E82_06137 [Cichorium intybus]